jgi:hypothetical protein
MGIDHIISVLFNIFQVLIGSASIYSLVNDALTLGLALMFTLYVTSFIKSRISEPTQTT